MNDGHTLEAGEIQAESKPISQEQLQHEVDYVRAQHILQSLFHKGLLSADEFAKITAVNRKTFSPVLAAILPSIH